MESTNLQQRQICGGISPVGPPARTSVSSFVPARSAWLAGAGVSGYAGSVLTETMIAQLEQLRERLNALGQRPSMQFPNASPATVEAIGILERYGPMCEAMYLVMVADGRVLNVERAVLRGALEVLAEGQVRSAHMEAMLDAAARACALQGASHRLEQVILALQGDPLKAELVAVLCAAVALADEQVTPEEQRVFERLAAGLGLGEARVAELLRELNARSLAANPPRS